VVLGLDTAKNDAILKKEVSSLRDNLMIPQFVMLADGDNELLVNFENLTSVKMLLSTVKKRASFTLTEFLFSNDGVVKNDANYFTNQVIISYYNEGKLNAKTSK